MSPEKWERVQENFDKCLQETTKEDFEKFFKQKEPGWVNVEDEVPQVYAMDFITKGYSTFKVKDVFGNEFKSNVCDGHVWRYEIAIPFQIIQWYRD